MFTIKKASASRAQMCQFCGVRPQYYDSGTGKLHPFCGRTCASKSKESKVPKVVMVVCDYCKRRPVSGSHLYCGDACATAAKHGKVGQPDTCSLTGCVKRAARYPIGSHWNYCTADHEELALRGCIHCRAVLYIGDSIPLCGPCYLQLVNSGPLILPVPADHIAYWDVVDQFNAAWTHPTKVPEIRMIYRIIPAPSVWDSYWAYRDTLEEKGQFSAQGKFLGNERSLWHGTARDCHLGEPGKNVFCTSLNCSLCSIVRGSYNIANVRANRFQRFGPGIYTSSTSSKANDYARNKIQSPWKAMLLNNVLAGLEYVTQVSEPYLTGPPSGYDSVYGQPGRDLNYDELIVYTNHAIRPSYLVMYE